MDTLYDLLGALPRDDADGLRAAFRRAVKGVHPDLNPHDPDAGRKFRQIVRAHDILADGEQRAAYDHLLELARIEASEQARAGRIHRLASWVMAFAGVSAVSLAGLALIALLWSTTMPAANTGRAADGPGQIKLMTLSAQPSPAAQSPAPPAETAAPPLGPPLDITPPGVLTTDHLPAAERAATDIAHGRPAAKAEHVTNARNKGAGPLTRPARRTVATDLSRLESAPFNPRP